MKVPYIYINGKCLNDEYRITNIEFLPRKVVINSNKIKNNKKLGEFKMIYYYDENDIKLEFKDIERR